MGIMLILCTTDASLALPETTPVLLSTQQIPSEPLRSLVQEQRWMVSSNTLALKREQPIETPDFRELTVSDVIGKTRALRSEVCSVQPSCSHNLHA